MFILVPACPGCPRQNPENHKTVAVVVAVVVIDDGVAVASAGPYANHLHLTPDR